MRARLIAFLTSLVVAWPAIAPANARTPEPTAEAPVLPAFADIRIDAAMEDAEYTRAWGTIGIERGLEQAPLDPGVLGSKRVTVELGGVFGAYRIAVGLTDNGQWAGDVAQRKCTCDDEEMINAIAEMVAALSTKIAVPPATSAAVTPPAAATDQPKKRRVPIGPEGTGGVVLGASGLVAAGVGAWFLVRDRAADEGSTDEHRRGRDFTGAGAVVLAAGISMLAAGVALIAVDRKRARRTRASAWWTPGQGGVAITGRF